MKRLLSVSGVVEAITGLALLVSPWLPVSLLFGAGPDTVAVLLVARVAGAAIFALAALCWMTRSDAGAATKRVVAAMLFYDVAVGALLVYAGLGLDLSGPGLWPAMLAHAALGLWCVNCLRLPERTEG